MTVHASKCSLHGGCCEHGPKGDMESIARRRAYEYERGKADGETAERERTRAMLLALKSKIDQAIRLADTDPIRPGDSGSEAWGK